MDNKKKPIIIIVVAVILALAVAAAVYFISTSGSGNKKDLGGVEELTPMLPSTMISDEYASLTPPSTTQPETTTLSNEELYIEDFLAEANTYTSTIEATTAPGAKAFFHVVTDGTVTDDNSLEGLTGAAKTIGEAILAAGFRYDKEQHIFYSNSESWQRNFGFTPLYDAGAALVGMYYDTMRLKFNYNHKDWMIQIWKGRYGITTGAEMGLYYQDENLNGEFYQCVPDSDTITMSFALYRGDDLYMTRGPERHWWLTGFRLFDMVAPGDLTLHCTFFMDNSEMADALEGALKELGFVSGLNYQRLGLTMTVIWR